MIGSALYGEGGLGYFDLPIDPIGTINMTGDIGDVLVFGPDYITDENGNIISGTEEEIYPLSIKIVDPSNLASVISTLPLSFDRSFIEEVNETGSGQLALSNTDSANINEIDLDKIINYYVYNTLAFSVFVESKNKISNSDQEEYGQITTYSGRGHLSIFENAVLYPSRGTEVSPIEFDRTFNWSTPTPVYDDSGWGYAKQICTVAAAMFIWPVLPFAEGWHDVNAGVIWANGATTLLAPGGDVYFRKDFELAQSGFYYLEAACDNRGIIYLDGQKVIEMGSFQAQDDYSVFITAGEHTIAVIGTNYWGGTPRVQGGPGQGPAGFALALYNTDSFGEPTNTLLRSDSTWKISAYPEDPPGMYVGEVIHTIVDEAVERDVYLFDEINLKFGPRLDSAGRQWPETLDIASKVGTSYLVFLIEQTSAYIDLWMKPGTLDLYAWKKGTRARTKNVILGGPLDVNDPLSGNVYNQTNTIV
jgi:hypothetical protein